MILAPDSPIEATDFERLLARANSEALSGEAAELAPEVQPILNGVPYKAFRQSVSLEDRRELGAFFSGPELSRELARALRTRLPEGGLVLDPTCGIGDLLIAYAEKLPLAGSLNETIENWGRRLAGIDQREDLVAMTKARLVALARSRGRFTAPIAAVDGLFPDIIVGDMRRETELIARADGILFNPPFGGVSDHDISGWGMGKLSAAAILLDAILEARAPDVVIAAVLPDVLRSGSRYRRFRERITGMGVSGGFRSHGRFDAWTDVDVFTTLLAPEPGPLWASPPSSKRKVGDRFTVRVGPVVPHRHEQKGQWQRFICARTVPAWAEAFTPGASRRFKGTLFQPPFVVVRRTSSPSDRKRAVGAIIVGERPVAVENHLIVLIPDDGRYETCNELLSILGADGTTDYLNDLIRCRHLTTGSVTSIPWLTAG
ncbi:hypothetical protein H5J25_00200 [Sphingomonas aliaeris]|uniref:DNA methylase adenine-specific domain-containing protein n=1 Tax=Sphingomonas aliaeris TaxID=2759526 RepID=A0A974NV16_9SPHN|nr:hypothetical protein [Sphingomonas aliaeris]QQV77310.1 hypothetical protein H5J25_00200 [Sphingomonas aliaeris]